MTVEPAVHLVPDPEEADSLVSSNDSDDMQNEQTWPTEEEMQDDSPRDITGEILPEGVPGTTPRAIRRVPKGTSAYQAAWIIDEDAGDNEYSGDETEGVPDGNAEEQVEVPAHAEDEMEIEIHDSKDVAFQDLDEEEENMQLVRDYFFKVPYSFINVKGWRAGVDGSEKNGTTESSLTKLTHRENCQPESGFSVTVGCDHSAPARGIPTRTCREIMHEYSSLRISKERSERFVDEPRSKPIRYQSAYFMLIQIGAS